MDTWATHFQSTYTVSYFSFYHFDFVLLFWHFYFISKYFIPSHVDIVLLLYFQYSTYFHCYLAICNNVQNFHKIKH